MKNEKTMKENERNCALFLEEYWSAAKKGTPECTFSFEKSEKCRNDKNGPLKNVHSFLEKNWGSALECVVFSGPECLVRNVHYSLGNWGSRPGGSPFSLGEEQTFFRIRIVPLETGGAAREGD